MSLEKGMDEAIAKVLATKIFEGLEGPDREAILTKGIAKVLGDYTISHLCKEALEERAKELFATWVKRGDYDKQILQALEESSRIVLARLPKAAEKALTQAFFGSERDSRGYSSSGIIIDIWSKEEK